MTSHYVAFPLVSQGFLLIALVVIGHVFLVVIPICIFVRERATSRCGSHSPVVAGGR
jgi:hypothetical protein